MIYKDDPSSLKGFLEDTSNLKTGHTPGAFFPESPEELSILLSEAPAANRRFTVAGNGTGTTGGRIPMGDYVISLEKLRNIGEIRQSAPEKAIVTVQAGALLDDVQKKTEAEGWLYPPDPTEKLCFIGSTIANNSSGARTFKYGPTREHISRILVVLPAGDMLDLPRGRHFADDNGFFHLDLPLSGHIEFRRPMYRMPDTSKHNAGYYSREGMDLIDLFIGSEGTLGVIAEADLMLIPLPEAVISCLVYFTGTDELFRFSGMLKDARNGLSPRALEFFDEHSLRFLSSKYPEIPPKSHGAVFLEIETTAENEERSLELLFGLMETCGAMAEDSWMALDREEQLKMKEFRHALPLLVNDWLSRQQESKISTDMAVPDAKFRELFDFYRTSCERHGFVYIIFGHIGNAHVHLNILPRNHGEFLEAKALYREFVTKAIGLGGTISAEHGIGKLKTEYLVEMYGENGIREMARVKKCLDPYLLLNIGNLVPAGYLVTGNQ
ncbi:MAG: FAD-binding oxidoreductase [Chlorobiaceae bacterium]|nr:FAD-binding oxidoreductase [Chlorobiaceae bacterium]